MNTRFSLVIPGLDADHGESLLAETERYVRGREAVMSRFGDGLVASVNSRASEDTVEVSEPLWAILMLCRYHWNNTNGLFDIARGRMAAVAFDDRRQTVRFMAPDVFFDLGGIGKGIALKGVEMLLRQHEIENAFVSFGESSILALGEHPEGGLWRVGLAADAKMDFTLSNEALSTSGQTPGSEHIIDPQHGGWASGPELLVVASACPIEAEVLSTALYIAAPTARADILSRYDKARWRELPAGDEPNGMVP
ncbi:FAD:protein FMN transferase [Rhizomicrobium electricum]|uniref:FAD:protein FMN transferase n=1 Tax=Rhizomicrobium electricum TaxID=480070 RepID=UPI0014207DDA|nr:FAD:protein FMN transferase [Rhizomicrobium electricum]NIJ49115.1 thiamine biosynthesis lipoprotein [Rhizomicrobium electricum]